MKTNIIQIGNNNGIILPIEILRQLSLSSESTVNVSVDNNAIVLKNEPSQGWAKAAKEFVESGNEENFFPDFFKNEDLDWWKWEQK